MRQQIKISEQQKVVLIESEERFAKLYHMGIIDFNGEYLGGIQDDVYEINYYLKKQAFYKPNSSLFSTIVTKSFSLFICSWIQND